MREFTVVVPAGSTEDQFLNVLNKIVEEKEGYYTYYWKIGWDSDHLVDVYRVDWYEDKMGQ